MTNQYTVLVIDDEPINITIISAQLKEICRVRAATSFDQACVAIERELPDLILLDIIMPDVDGFEAAKRFKAMAETRDIPLIFLTGQDCRSSEIKGLALGAVDFINKPILPDILRARVMTHLELRRRTLDLETANRVINDHNQRMSTELNVARELQQGFLPELPRDHRFSLAAQMTPALELGGDFYDLYFVSEEEVCLCVGDVSGKGVPAALLMSMCKSLIRSKTSSLDSPAAVAKAVNRSLLEGNDSCMFVTLYLAFLNVNTGRMTYTNAGHCKPVLAEENGKPRFLEGRHGLPLGVMDGEYTESDTFLKTGESVLLYTDGVVEASNTQAELYGEDRLIELLEETDTTEPNATVHSITTAMETYQEDCPQADDITLLALRWTGASGQQAVKERFTSNEQSFDFSRFDELLATMKGAELVPTIHLILDEMISNVLSHGRFNDGVCSVDVELRADANELCLEFSDAGAPFNPLDIPPPNLTAGIEDRQPGGLGIHVCRETMDDMQYRRCGTKNVIRLTRRITKEISAWPQSEP